jgi:hypothetical protein
MAFIHGKGTAVLVGAFDLTAYFNDATTSAEVSADETTSFGFNDKTYIAGLGDGKISAAGMFDTTATVGADVVLAAALGSSAPSNVLIAHAGLAVGNRCSVAAGLETNYEISEKVSEVAAVKADFQGTGGMDAGVVLAAAKSVATATTTNEASVDNAASSANGGTGWLHVTTNGTSSTTIVKVQHSANDSTWADLVTFATVATTVTKAERVLVAEGTTVNRYVRAISTTAGTGAVVYTVAFARR